ncbi:hypothetical protein DL93DRAFT_1678988 [Clavulina sp. PMI_390]|nr:hypothetical protein DL93DRAFT_1678988 [Clavulina sp. PMI_390]
MKSADKVEICYRCFVDGRSCACGQMSLISLGTLVQLLRIRNGGTRFVQNLVRHGGIDQDVPEVSEVIKTGIVRKSELGQRPIREEHTMVTLAGVYLNKYRRRPLVRDSIPDDATPAILKFDALIDQCQLLCGELP